MPLRVSLSLLGDADGRTHYVEEPTGEKPLVLGTLSLDSGALPQPAPAVIEVTVKFSAAAAAGRGEDAICSSAVGSTQGGRHGHGRQGPYLGHTLPARMA